MAKIWVGQILLKFIISLYVSIQEAQWKLILKQWQL
jgi:hypothetical protein